VLCLYRAVEMDHPDVVEMIRRVTGEVPPEKYFWYYPAAEMQPEPEHAASGGY
jgi:hypothetical protein